MNIFKSHFWYHKNQRNGILFLVLVIICFQLVLTFFDFSSDELQDLNSKEALAFQQKIDSLKTIEIESRNFGRKPKIYPFNPNFITDFKGEQLGMSLKEIDRLHKFRKQNKFVNSVREFKQVTKVSDSLLAKISPYFKFPDWVVERNRRIWEEQQQLKITTKKNNSNDFKDVEDSSEEVVFEKINVNTATFKEVLQIPGIDYELCKKIFEFRDQVAELQDISELKNIEDFPLEKYDQIIVYLTAK